MRAPCPHAESLKPMARFHLPLASEQDATVNAIILLDLLSHAVTSSIEDQLEELQPLFERFMT